MRRRVRDLALRVAGPSIGTLLTMLLRLTSRRVGLAVVFHATGDPPGNPDRELVPKLGTRLLDAQVRYLRRRFHLVPASELLDAVAGRRRGERFPLAITFDDDLSSHAEVAAPLLRRRGAPATFFLCGASIERPHRFWWELLQATVDRGLAERELFAEVEPPNLAERLAADPGAVHELALAIQLMPAPSRAAIVSRMETALGPPAPDAGLREDALRALADGGFEIGFHTRDHEFLPPLTDAELARALSDGREPLERIVGEPLASIAYPHGSADRRVAAAALAAGFHRGFTGDPTAVRGDADPLLIGRIEGSLLSTGHLAARLVKALLREVPALS
jgi:peptidoglycan/xylan/chitin deacetylase (PgdA/CDA1 family)